LLKDYFTGFEEGIRKRLNFAIRGSIISYNERRTKENPKEIKSHLGIRQRYTRGRKEKTDRTGF